jgi:DNA polymerase III delta subunit
MLVVPKVSVDPFALLDAIGSKNKSHALQMLGNFFDHSAGDEKAKAIQFSALLADQLRNVLLVIDAVDKRIPDETILDKTGWKSGRLYVMKKLSRSYNPAQIKLTLAKLESLDIELKTSTMPPHVVLDMIISQM